MLKRFTNSLLVWCTVGLTGCAVLPGQPSPGPEKAQDKSMRASEAAVAPMDGVARNVPQAIAVPVPEVKSANREKFARALELMEIEDWEVAAQLLTEITVDQPELAGPWVNLGLSRLAQEDHAGAESALEQALVANPYNCDALNQLGMLAREAGEFAQAEQHYIQCMEANPSYLAARLNLGILYDLYMGRYGEALAVYQDYQLALSEPDPRVNGWLLDLERRVAALAQR